MGKTKLSFFFFGLGFAFIWKGLTAPYVSPGFQNTIIQIVVALAFVLFWKPLERFNKNQQVIWIVAALSSLSNMCLFIGAANPDLAYVSNLVSGFATGSFMAFVILWSELYVRMNAVSACYVFSASYILGSAGYFMFALLPQSFYPGITLILPFLSAAFITISLRSTPEPKILSRQNSMESFQSNRVIQTTASLYPFKLVPWATPSLDLLSAGIGGCITIIVVFLFNRHYSIFSIYRISLIVVISCIVFVLLILGYGLYSQILINVSCTLTMTILVLILCDRSYRFGVSVLFLNGIGRSFTQTMFLLGSLTGIGIEVITNMPNHSAAIILAAAAVAALSFIVLMRSSRPSKNDIAMQTPSIPLDLFDLESTPILKKTGNTSDASSSPIKFKSTGWQTEDTQIEPALSSSQDASELLHSITRQRCEKISEEYHLSERECEVLYLLATGNSGRTIQELLTISYNTVKTHMQHIYTKLGIHSRKELELLVLSDHDE